MLTVFILYEISSFTYLQHLPNHTFGSKTEARAGQLVVF